VLAGRSTAASHAAGVSPSAAGADADEGLGSAVAAREIPGPADEDVGANFFGVSRCASPNFPNFHTSLAQTVILSLTSYLSRSICHSATHFTPLSLNVSFCLSLHASLAQSVMLSLTSYLSRSICHSVTLPFCHSLHTSLARALISPLPPPSPLQLPLLHHQLPTGVAQVCRTRHGRGLHSSTSQLNLSVF